MMDCLWASVTPFSIYSFLFSQSKPPSKERILTNLEKEGPTEKCSQTNQHISIWQHKHPIRNLKKVQAHIGNGPHHQLLKIKVMGFMLIRSIWIENCGDKISKGTTRLSSYQSEAPNALIYHCCGIRLLSTVKVWKYAVSLWKYFKGTLFLML